MNLVEMFKILNNASIVKLNLTRLLQIKDNFLPFGHTSFRP